MAETGLPQEATPVDMGPGNPWQHPPSFYCPISQQCMHDPVVLSDGHSYERRHIERWLKQRSTSPVTRANLLKKDVYPNHALRNAIEEYFQQVFSVHRRAIRESIGEPGGGHFLGSNAPLLRTIDALMQSSLLVNADLSVERVLKHIMQEAKALVGAEVASAFLVDHVRGELFSTVNSTGSEIRIPLNVGIAGHVAATGEQVIIYDTYSDAHFDRSVDKKTGFTTRNMMCVPLSVRNQGVLGVVQLINKTTSGVLQSDDSPKHAAAPTSAEEGNDRHYQSFTTEDLHFLQVFASQAANAIVHSGALERQQHQHQQQLPPSQRPPGAMAWDTPPASNPSSPKCEQMSLLRKQCWDRFQAQEDVPSCAAEDSTASRGSSGDLTRAVGAWKDEDTKDMERSASTCECKHLHNKPLPRRAQDTVTIERVRSSFELEVLSEAVKSWEFSALDFAEITGNQPLCRLFAFLCESFDVAGRMGLDSKKVLCFVGELERGYPDSNAYHTRAHAASVLHSMHALLELGGLAQLSHLNDAECTFEETRLACWIAAAVHDYDHLGLTNDFLVRTHHERAVFYNDQHVNEQHHAAQAFALMKRADCNFLEGALSSSAFRRLRALTIDLVVATDMADHGRIVKSFSGLLDAREPVGESGASAPFVPANSAEASQLLQVAMKTADLGHLSMNWSTHLRWVDRLEREFFEQGDMETALEIPVSFLMDRTKPGPSQTQVGFYDYVVFPLLLSLVRAAPDAEHVLRGATSNREHWKELEDAREEEAAKAKEEV